MLIVMDMETGRIETPPRQAADLADEIACANWVDVPPRLQHQVSPRLSERVAEPEPDLLSRIYCAQRP